MSSVPTTAAMAVAMNTPPFGIPAAESMSGLTARMYAIVMNVVMPATSSVRTDVRFRLSLKSRPRSVVSGSSTSASRVSHFRCAPMRIDSSAVTTPSSRTSSSAFTNSAISAFPAARGRAKSSSICASARSTLPSSRMVFSSLLIDSLMLFMSLMVHPLSL